MTPAEQDQARSLLYDRLSADPGGPDAPQIRRMLGKLKKLQMTGVGRDPLHGSREPRNVIHGELSGGDLGYELPPTPDEVIDARSGSDGGLFGTRKATVSVGGNRVASGNFKEPRVAGDLATPGALGKAVSTVTDETARREFERGVDDMVTFGVGQKLAHAIGSRLGDQSFSKENQAMDERQSPRARGYGRLVGTFAPGATNLVSKGALELTAPALMLGRGGVAGGAFAGALRGGLANELAIPVIEGAQAGIDEGSLDSALEAARHAADPRENPANLILGGAFGGLGGGARGLREGRGHLGKDIRLVEEYGAKPTPLGGVKGGVFEYEPFASERGSAFDVGRTSRKAARSVLGGLEEEGQGLSREYEAGKQAAGDAGFLEGRIPPDNVMSEVDRLMASKGLTKAEKAAIKTEVTDVLAEHPGGMTVDDFNDFRGKLGRIFGVGPGETSIPAVDRLRRAAKADVDTTEMGPINERYSKGTEALDKKYDQLKITRDTDPRVAEERVANLIARRGGEENISAGIQDPAVEEFLTANPQYKPLFDTAALLAAKERMTPGLGAHGGFFRRLSPHHLLEKNLEPVGVGAYRIGSALGEWQTPASLAAQLLLGQMEGQ